ELPEPIISEQSLAMNLANEGGVANLILLLRNITGLWLLQESRRKWQQKGQGYSWDDLLTLAEETEPFRSLVDPDSEDFLNPEDMPAAIRSYCQRTGQPEPESVGAFIRCCLESLALKYRWVLEALETVSGCHAGTIRIVGGGSQNRLLSQLTADACQRLVVTGPAEATALGNIMVQSIATGHLPDLKAGREAIVASVQQQEFEPRVTSGLEDAYGRFCELLNREALSN
ncbi:FGGY-family carbohydrate kinase, partial [Acidobacteria bacterium AH-259-O06]|nr:FGGY-family carbohydrate kinase [Acidobacteria bacterium AH-259-O06]